MPERGRLDYWGSADNEVADSGYLRLFGATAQTIVWAGPADAGSPNNQMGQISLRHNGNTRARLWSSPQQSGAGRLWLWNSTGDRTVALSGATAGLGLWDPAKGQTVDIHARDQWSNAGVNLLYQGSIRARLRVTSTGFGKLELWNSSGQKTIDLDAETGTITASGAKPFSIPHPTLPGYRLRYCAVEAPEAAVFVRGTLRLRNGRGSVALPKHFRLVASPRGLTCNLTPRSPRSRGVSLAFLSPRRLAAREANKGNGSYLVDYVIIGVRKDITRFQVARRETGWDAQQGASVPAHRQPSKSSKAEATRRPRNADVRPRSPSVARLGTAARRCS